MKQEKEKAMMANDDLQQRAEEYFKNSGCCPYCSKTHTRIVTVESVKDGSIETIECDDCHET